MINELIVGYKSTTIQEQQAKVDELSLELSTRESKNQIGVERTSSLVGMDNPLDSVVIDMEEYIREQEGIGDPTTVQVSPRSLPRKAKWQYWLISHKNEISKHS